MHIEYGEGNSGTKKKSEQIEQEKKWNEANVMWNEWRVEQIYK